MTSEKLDKKWLLQKSGYMAVGTIEIKSQMN